jgi:hypothetical protein
MVGRHRLAPVARVHGKVTYRERQFTGANGKNDTGGWRCQPPVSFFPTGSVKTISKQQFAMM